MDKGDPAGNTRLKANAGSQRLRRRLIWDEDMRLTGWVGVWDDPARRVCNTIQKQIEHGAAVDLTLYNKQ
jgi:hypothetical protein